MVRLDWNQLSSLPPSLQVAIIRVPGFLSIILSNDCILPGTDSMTRGWEEKRKHSAGNLGVLS